MKKIFLLLAVLSSYTAKAVPNCTIHPDLPIGDPSCLFVQSLSITQYQELILKGIDIGVTDSDGNGQLMHILLADLWFSSDSYSNRDLGYHSEEFWKNYVLDKVKFIVSNSKVQLNSQLKPELLGFYGTNVTLISIFTRVAKIESSLGRLRFFE